jgi:general secretion pathway protein D
VESEYEVVQLRYADPREVESSIGDGFRDLPGTEFLPSILVQPLTQTKQVIVFGRKDLREIVKKMIAEVDVPPGQFETAHIPLKHADPDTIKEKLDELYQEGSTSSRSSSFGFYGGYNPYSSRGRGSSQTSEMVKVIAYPSLKEVTVVASPENMADIKKRIAEWDVPLDVEAVKPRIIELRNMDPVQMADLLNTLFSSTGGSSTNRSVSILRSIFGSQTAGQEKIVGALYGQLTFEEVPGTKKIIVISKVPEAYEVIEKLVSELDKEEMAEIPTVVMLKYADPEVLSEILNAMFAEAGTSATLRRSATGLSQYSMDTSTSSNSSSSSGTQTTTAQTNYTPWWSGAGARQTVNTEMPISNVIGKIRFVPDPRTKSLLVLSPPEYVSEIKKLIETLDIPGKQVMIKAIIVEVDHKNLSSLGVQLATDPAAFGTLDENSIMAVNALTDLERHGTIALGTGGSITGRGVLNTFTADVSVLVDFLAKTVNAKVLNQQTLWTEDNEEASFFKGNKVAFFTSATSSATAGNVQSFEFQRVGMTLAVRPSITPGNDVDMIINIIISQLTAEEQNSQPVRTEMETKTNMIIEDGQTLMLGGILFQQDSVTHRKVPLLGDIPLLGALFSHNETIAANNELLIFITPYVIDEPDKTGPATKEEIQRSKEKLDNIRGAIDATMEQLDK